MLRVVLSRAATAVVALVVLGVTASAQIPGSQGGFPQPSLFTPESFRPLSSFGVPGGVAESLLQAWMNGKT